MLPFPFFTQIFRLNLSVQWVWMCVCLWMLCTYWHWICPSRCRRWTSGCVLSQTELCRSCSGTGCQNQHPGDVQQKPPFTGQCHTSDMVDRLVGNITVLSLAKSSVKVWSICWAAVVRAVILVKLMSVFIYFLTKCLPSAVSSSCPAGRQVNKLTWKENGRSGIRCCDNLHPVTALKHNNI